MFRRSGAVVFSGNTVAEEPVVREDVVREHSAGSYRSGYLGGLDTLFDDRPSFRGAMRGYDRLEVDNYVAWMQSELTAARREADDLMARYGRCSAELELSRRLLAQSPQAQELTRTSDRIGTMLRLAAEEAAAMKATGAGEADRIVAEARVEADARLRKAHEIKQLAVASSDQLHAEARRLRVEATAELERARAERREVSRRIQEQRREAEAASVQAAAEQTVALRAEVEELHRQRARVQESLRRLTEQMDDALEALTAGPAAAALELVAVSEPGCRAAS